MNLFLLVSVLASIRLLAAVADRRPIGPAWVARVLFCIAVVLAALAAVDSLARI